MSLVSIMDISSPNKIKDTPHELEYLQHIFNFDVQKLQEKQKPQVIIH